MIREQKRLAGARWFPVGAPQQLLTTPRTWKRRAGLSGHRAAGSVAQVAPVPSPQLTVPRRLLAEAPGTPQLSRASREFRVSLRRLATWTRVLVVSDAELLKGRRVEASHRSTWRSSGCAAPSVTGGKGGSTVPTACPSRSLLSIAGGARSTAKHLIIWIRWLSVVWANQTKARSTTPG